MRISTCIVSSDLNPLYIDFFPLVHATWRRLAGIRCVLLLIADAIPPALEPLAADIVLVPPLPDVHSGLMAQCVRLTYPQLIECPADTTLMISDIDMLPMSSRYFAEGADFAPRDNIVVFRSNTLMHDYREIAICYNAATPSTWRDLVGNVRDADGAAAMIRTWAADTSYAAVPGGAGWSTDQILLYRFVRAFDRRRVTLRRDRTLGICRLDRAHIGDALNPRQRQLVELGIYTDYHMKRPQAEFAALNTEIAELAIAAAASPPPPHWYDRPLRWLGLPR